MEGAQDYYYTLGDEQIQLAYSEQAATISSDLATAGTTAKLRIDTAIQQAYQAYLAAAAKAQWQQNNLAQATYNLGKATAKALHGGTTGHQSDMSGLDEAIAAAQCQKAESLATAEETCSVALANAEAAVAGGGQGQCQSGGHQPLEQRHRHPLDPVPVGLGQWPTAIRHQRQHGLVELRPGHGRRRLQRGHEPGRRTPGTRPDAEGRAQYSRQHQQAAAQQTESQGTAAARFSSTGNAGDATLLYSEQQALGQADDTYACTMAAANATYATQAPRRCN